MRFSFTEPSGCHCVLCFWLWGDGERLRQCWPQIRIRRTAARVAEATVDVSEYLGNLAATLTANFRATVAWHPPCSLQHGQQVEGLVEKLLIGAGYELLPVADAHLCCGSAGTYSVLQPDWSDQLRQNKLHALQSHQPDLIATANVGCQTHLASAANTPVLHWIELLS